MNTNDIRSANLKSDEALYKSISGAIKNHVRFNGYVHQHNVTQLTNKIIGEIAGIVHNAMIAELNHSTDTERFIVVSRKEYEAAMQRDLREQNKWLVARLKELDPNFNGNQNKL